MKKIYTLLFSLALLLLVRPAFADTVTVNFEDPPYTLGVINAQDGWSSLGAAGSGCAVYDHAVNGALGTTGFGLQSLRISNAVTSGCFGDQTFAKPLVNSVGETSATAGSFTVGSKQTHFEMQFDIASTVPASEQPGLFLSVSPDRGDGSRMSYVGFQDTAGGLKIIFYDVQGTTNPANFVLTDLGTYSRAPHTIKLALDVIDGPSNDVVKVWVDGVLKHTGTSWENYYRFDSEASAEQSVRIVKTAIFRSGGTAAPATAGNGFLIDNLSLRSGPSTVKVTIDKYIDGVMATSVTANSSAFPMNATWSADNIGAGSGSYNLSTVGFNSPNPYEAVTSDMTFGADYSTYEVTGGPVVGASCSTGQPYVLVGYTTGDSLAAAQGTTPTLAVPTFTDIQTNKNVIVWNQTCPPPDPYALPAECSLTGYEYGAPIIGTAGNNNINGTSGNDLIFGLGGNDKINGKGGHDCIVGGDNNDRLTGGTGDDVLLGGSGNDAIDGDSGQDVLYGNENNDSLKGGSDNDKLYGGSGNDALDGDSGDDTLDGELDTDAAKGGSGIDACTAESEKQCEI